MIAASDRHTPARTPRSSRNGSKHIGLHLRDDHHALVRELARRERRSISSYVLYALLRDLRDLGYLDEHFEVVAEASRRPS